MAEAPLLPAHSPPLNATDPPQPHHRRHLVRRLHRLSLRVRDPQGDIAIRTDHPNPPLQRVQFLLSSPVQLLTSPDTWPKLLRFTLLAPDIVEAVLDGRLPKGVRLEDLVRPLPSARAEQRRPLFGDKGG